MLTSVLGHLVIPCICNYLFPLPFHISFALSKYLILFVVLYLVGYPKLSFLKNLGCYQCCLNWAVSFTLVLII